MRKGLVLACFGLLLPVLYVFAITVIYKNNPDKIPSINFFFMSLLAGLVLSFIIMLPSWISWYYSVFIVTDQRLIQITQKGMFHRTVVDLTLAQIQMVNYQIAGLQQTLLGFGTIMMQTYMGDLVVHHIHHPAKIQKKLMRILREKGIINIAYPNTDSANDKTGVTDES